MADAVFSKAKSEALQGTAEAGGFWPESVVRTWGQQPVQVPHALHQSPLFARNRLAELIEHYPREHYSIIHMGAQGDSAASRVWSEGEIRNLSGEDTLQAIEAGRFWLNLRYTDLVDPEFRALQEQIVAELAQRLPPAQLGANPSLGVLISSPNAQVYYHCDLPNQSLWQISGSKTVYVYPNIEPFLSAQDLEKIAIFELEIDLDYEPWFDEFAVKYDFQPGQMLHWPLNAPHRIENHNCLNVSLTSEYWTEKALLNQRLNMANGTLRYKLGITPRSRRTSGVGFFAKSAVQALLARTGWLEGVRKKNKPLEFALDDRSASRT